MFKQTDSTVISACSITQKELEGASITIETEDVCQLVWIKATKISGVAEIYCTRALVSQVKKVLLF